MKYKYWYYGMVRFCREIFVSLQILMIRFCLNIHYYLFWGDVYKQNGIKANL